MRVEEEEEEDEHQQQQQQQQQHSFSSQLPSPEELTPLSQTLITPPLALAFDIPTTHHHADFEEPARTLKRPRLVWTPQLHKRFVDAVSHLGIKNAVPKTIMQLMSVDGLTRENVASHLQKYRLYLKRMQSLNTSNSSSGDPATDHLFASSPVPPHFLHPQGYLSTAGPQFHHHQHRQVGQFEHPFLPRQGQIGGRADLEPATGASGRKVLTLFPTPEN